VKERDELVIDEGSRYMIVSIFCRTVMDEDETSSQKSLHHNKVKKKKRKQKREIEPRNE
jgi:hypothetical protein